MLKPVSIEIPNGSNVAIKKRPFTVGVPCSRGALFSLENLGLESNGKGLPFNATPLASWQDGSVKWLLLDFQASVEPNNTALLQLGEQQLSDQVDNQSEPVQVAIDDTGDTYQIDTGVTQFIVNKRSLALFDQIVYDDNTLLSEAASGIRLTDGGDEPAIPKVTAVSVVDPDNRLRKKISIDGFFQNAKEESLVDFNLKLNFYAGSSTVKGEFTLANSRAAEHPGGVWDLGDSGSFFFNSLSIDIQLADESNLCQSSVRITPDIDWRLSEHSAQNNANLMLEQYSSGGKNWQSENHMDCRGEVPLKHKGFRYFEQGVQVSSGDRAQPTVHLSSGDRGLTAHIVDFWQNFPKGIQVDQSTVTLNFFPRSDADNYELQGGERKSHTFYLDFSNDKASLDAYINKATPRIALDYYAQTKVISWLPASRQESMMQELIDRGIEGENNFFEKRETIDEFGWRNFGEIYADHEESEYKGNDQLISHYNNQYDPVYGFIKQYLVTGDERWHELLSDLAQHIVDIDIYHTTEDRDEYNGGLFWHTHHYLKAFTCTHRTFSHEHAADFLYGEIGGGPGNEHCYTTGLSYCYFMTGDEKYKDAVLQLVNWISRVFDGSGTVIERVLQFKNKELPILKRLISGETIQRYKYPFNRGTGNYITALLDAYSLTGERSYLSTVESVIRQSMHPRDDISLRNLDHIEVSWSYLVYLQAVCKYLDLKTKLQEVDEACLYAKDSLLHYVDWMLENETPFLQKADNVEYPNHTWTAQDLRKANVFYIASLYSEDKKDRYLEAAHFYVGHVEETLAKEETRYYSRIIILLMQNDLQESSLDYDTAEKCRNVPTAKPDFLPPLYSVSGLLFGFFKDIGSRILSLSFKEEKRWLRFRMK